MEIRAYHPTDCEQIAQLFYETVHTINAKDYTQEQLDAWATGTVDMVLWNQSFLIHDTLVAVQDDKIIGFGDMDQTGYFDRLYVHKDYQRQGIATLLCNQLEKRYQGRYISTHASITAKPFFEHRGYLVIAKQQVERLGILLVNYRMEKQK
ncbi:GNAT family N-acetyltransferase [Massilioclostridium coli]|uniref:GNAT family N-acetyltransferase n=1 Tax=Massilioclostridium coli TaxID=1870991 RepID=UPI0022DEAFBE|nr:GNAT family N-acetyltransferase [Massilioclostridium coli]